MHRYIDYDPSFNHNPYRATNKPTTKNHFTRIIQSNTSPIEYPTHKEINAALGKIKAYFEDNKEEILSALNVIEDRTTKLMIRKDLEILESTLQDVPRQDPDLSKPHLARKVAPVLDFEDLIAERKKHIHQKFNIAKDGINYYSAVTHSEYRKNPTPSSSVEEVQSKASLKKPAATQYRYDEI